MKKFKGFRLLRRRWPLIRRPNGYVRVSSPSPQNPPKLCILRWLCCLLTGEKAPPRGHLAVYVGEAKEEREWRRYVVPVVYFNDPLFAELLSEAEEEFGFERAGGIRIPCPVARFEMVRAYIDGRRRTMAGRFCWSSGQCVA